MADIRDTIHYHAAESLWHTPTPHAVSDPFKDRYYFDVVVVGAGITGLTTALKLQSAGLEVGVIEADGLGKGVTGHSSAHLTNILIDARYSTILKRFGRDATMKAYKSHSTAIKHLQDWVNTYGIDCDLKPLTGYWFAEFENQLPTLEEEWQALQHLHVEAERTEHVPLPFETCQGIAIPNQARFHPVKYLEGLAKVFQEQGGKLILNTHVNAIHTNVPMEVVTDYGKVQADSVVLATHSPIGFHPILQSHLIPIRSYIMVVRVTEPVEDALFWDFYNPYHYIRKVSDEEQPLLVIGGADHMQGDKTDPRDCFKRLERYARQRFNVTHIETQWSAQLFQPADGLPYIGQIADQRNLYVATGLSGEGLSGGTMAGLLISDQILKRHNPLIDLYAPSRFHPRASARNLIQEGTHTLKHFVGDRLQSAPTIDIEGLGLGEGRLMKHNGDKAAVYRDENAHVHIMSPKCTHMGCIVHWNPAEKSWDCPCHGGRFRPTGEVMSGPPTRPLEKRPELTREVSTTPEQSPYPPSSDR